MVSPPASHRRRFAPISLYQRQMIAVAQDPATTAFYHEHKTIRWAFRIGPAVPPRTLRRAFEKLVARHTSLRLRFVERQGDWQAEVLDKHPVGLVVEDLSGQDATAQEAHIRARALAPMTALDEPMFEMILLRGCAGGDVVLTRAHHAIIDGYSVAVLIEELLKIVLNMPLEASPPSHADFIALRTARLAEQTADKAAFWRESLLPLPPDPQIGRAALGLDPLAPHNAGPTIRLGDILSAAQSSALEARAKADSVSAYSLLHAAFSEEVCARGKVAQVMMNSVVGRQDAPMAAFIGADMQGIMLKYDADPDDIAGRAAWVANSVAQGAAHLPTDAFAPDQPVPRAFVEAQTAMSRFSVHISHPRGRLANSPFRTLFDKGLEGRISFGNLTLERIPLPGTNETEFELECLIAQGPDGANAALIADAAGFAPADLQQIAQGMCLRLGLNS